MNSKQIGTFIFTAAAAWAVYRFFEMSKDERQRFVDDLKSKTSDLLEDADATVEKVQHYFSQMQNNRSGDLFDKIFIVRKMLQDFYGSQRVHAINSPSVSA